MIIGDLYLSDVNNEINAASVKSPLGLPFTSRRPSKIELGIYFDVEAGAWCRYDIFQDDLIKLSLDEVVNYLREVDAKCATYHSDFIELGHHRDLGYVYDECVHRWVKAES